MGSTLWTDTGTDRPHLMGAGMGNLARQDGTAPVPAEDEGGTEAEQRSAPRFALLIRSAKLTSPVGEFLCVVRDASETGVSVRLFHALPVGPPLTLELPNGDRHEVERVWEEEGKAGFTFAQPTEIARIVEGPSLFSKRAMRVNLERPCELLIGTERVEARLCNLSQEGALIATEERLSLVQRVKLRADGLPEVAAKVRWRRNGRYGLSFEENFQFGDLARIVFDLQQPDTPGLAVKAGR